MGIQSFHLACVNAVQGIIGGVAGGIAGLLPNTAATLAHLTASHAPISNWYLEAWGSVHQMATPLLSKRLETSQCANDVVAAKSFGFSVALSLSTTHRFCGRMSHAVASVDARNSLIFKSNLK